MPTTLRFTDVPARFLSLASAPGGFARLLVTDQPTAETSVVVGTLAGASAIPIACWALKPLAPVTISGSISMMLRGFESNNQANATLALRLYKYPKGSTALPAAFASLFGTVELGTSQSLVLASATPTSTSFTAADYLVAEVLASNIGAMGGGRTVTFQFGGPVNGGSSDSTFTLSENVSFAQRAVISG